MNASFIIIFALILAPPLSSQDLTVAERGNLYFGHQLFPGVDATVAYEDAEAAMFELTGEEGMQVRVFMELPGSLIQNSQSMPVSFGQNSAGYHTMESGQSTAIEFDPHEGFTTSLGTDGKLYIWLGGTLYPADNQQKGVYIGDIILEAEYTSN